jgi:hypothetical protein
MARDVQVPWSDRVCRRRRCAFRRAASSSHADARLAPILAYVGYDVQ